MATKTVATLVIDLGASERLLMDAVNHYLEVAPMVGRWLDGLYEDMFNEDGDNTTVGDLRIVNRFLPEDGQWMSGNYAQNLLYHHLYAHGKDTTGMLDF